MTFGEKLESLVLKLQSVIIVQFCRCFLFQLTQ